jgi:MscS family membrane protein
MRSAHKSLLICVIGLLATSRLPAQKLPGALNPQSATGITEQPSPVDPLGRQTPSGCVFGFLEAAQNGKYQTAAQYLQLGASRRQTQGEELAKELKAVLDRSSIGSIRNISTKPEGSAQEGFPLDREKIGTINSGENELNVVLVRVADPSSGKIWLFSADTLAKVPDLYADLQAHEVETKLPSALVRNEFLGAPVWQWFALILAIPVSALLAWLLIQLFRVPGTFWRRYRHRPQIARWALVSGPVWLILGTIVHRILVAYLRLPLLQRHYYFMASNVVAIIGVGWLGLRLLARGMQLLRDRALMRGHAGTGSLVLLGQRILKVVIIIFASLAILSALGFNMTTALAGLGIGGLAIGFGAQKTIENLFGGVSVLGDEVIRVGDTCRIGDRIGTIEDISLRSTRIRTLERTELSVPNGTLATINVENFTRRDKVLFNTTIGVRYETSADQLRFVLAETRRLLYEHPKVETASARVRFAGLDQNALSIEIFSYILTQDFGEFTAIREDLLLRMMNIVSDAGSGFAFPSRTIYLGKDSGLDRERTEVAVQKIQRWREEKQLPFPDFAPTEIAEFRDSLPYPPPDSASGNRQR